MRGITTNCRNEIMKRIMGQRVGRIRCEEGRRRTKEERTKKKRPTKKTRKN